MRRGSVILLFGLVVVYHLADLMRVAPTHSGNSPAAEIPETVSVAASDSDANDTHIIRVPAGHSLVVSSLDESAGGH